MGGSKIDKSGVRSSVTSKTISQTPSSKRPSASPIKPRVGSKVSDKQLSSDQRSFDSVEVHRASFVTDTTPYAPKMNKRASERGKAAKTGRQHYSRGAQIGAAVGAKGGLTEAAEKGGASLRATQQGSSTLGSANVVSASGNVATVQGRISLEGLDEPVSMMR